MGFFALGRFQLPLNISLVPPYAMISLPSVGFNPKLRHPMVIVEKRDGGFFLQPAPAVPVRDLPKGTIEQWIARDEADMAALRAPPRKAVDQRRSWRL